MNAHHVTEVAHAQSRGDRVAEAQNAARTGALAGIAVAVVFTGAPQLAIVFAAIGAALAAATVFFRPRAIDCSLCDTTLAVAAGRCPGCAASIRGRR